MQLEGEQAEGGAKGGARAHTAPNQALEPTPSSVRYAPASGSS